MYKLPSWRDIKDLIGSPSYLKYHLYLNMPKRPVIGFEQFNKIMTTLTKFNLNFHRIITVICFRLGKSQLKLNINKHLSFLGLRPLGKSPQRATL